MEKNENESTKNFQDDNHPEGGTDTEVSNVFDFDREPGTEEINEAFISWMSNNETKSRSLGFAIALGQTNEKVNDM